MKENWKDVSGNVLWQCCRPTSLMRIFFLSLFSRPKWPTLVFNDVVYLSGFFCGPTFFSVKTSNLVKNFPLQMSFFMLVIAVFLVGWIDNETRFFNFFLSRSLTPHSRFFFVPHHTRRRTLPTITYWCLVGAGQYDELRRDLPMKNFRTWGVRMHFDLRFLVIFAQTLM